MGLFEKIENNLIDHYSTIRQNTLDLCKPLQLEDYALQVMPEVSPPKWHLAHTSWFFETFILKVFSSDYRVFHPQFEILFNSYYNGIGVQHPRAQRGFLSRPSVEEVIEYRLYVDEAMQQLLLQLDHKERKEILRRCELGLHHEQQHQELLLTDIKYSFSFNPLYPALMSAPDLPNETVNALRFNAFEINDAVIGYQGDQFHFDNEMPQHPYYLQPFSLADRVISNGEYLAFIEDGGYTRAELWLADGWFWVQQQNVTSPCYWKQQGSNWHEYTLYGLLPLNSNQPLCHINYYEADAFARWAGKRLPTEFEWEAACKQVCVLPENKAVSLHPTWVNETAAIKQLFGCVWQWTQSSYSAYPGYRPDEGAIGEYNGKFMSNQMVLRGSSCVTPSGHARVSYRNFFYAKDRWQFSGIRLAESL